MAIMQVDKTSSYGGFFDEEPVPAALGPKRHELGRLASSTFWQQHRPAPALAVPASMLAPVIVGDHAHDESLPKLRLVPVDESEDLW